MLALAQYWNLLAGYAGLVSVGQQAFVGLGGYLLFALTIFADLDPLLAILLARRRSPALCAVPTAFVVFRLRGAYFAIGTWVVAEVYRLVLAQFKQLGGGTGTSLPPDVTNDVARHRMGRRRCSMCARRRRATSSPTGSRLRSSVGTVLRWSTGSCARGAALRSPPSAIPRPRPKASASTISAPSSGSMSFAAVGTGMVGALIYLQKARISPDAAFSVLDWTAYVIFIVVIGGIGTIEGPIVGVIVFYLLQTYLASFGTWYLILLGALAIVIMLFAPRASGALSPSATGSRCFRCGGGSRARKLPRRTRAPSDLPHSWLPGGGDSRANSEVRLTVFGSLAWIVLRRRARQVDCALSLKPLK